MILDEILGLGSFGAPGLRLWTVDDDDIKY